MSPPTRTAPAGRAERARALPALDLEAGLLIAITLVAAVVRFGLLGHQSYWLDESQAAHEVSRSFGPMLHAWSKYEGNPPLYLILGWLWAHVFGSGEVGLRSLSAVVGIGVIPLIYLSGAELVSRRAGLVAAAFAAVNPFLIWYSQEAREYMLLVFTCTGSLLFFARAWRRSGDRELLGWALFSALALLTQYFAGFLIAAEGVLLVYRLRSRSSLIALLAVGVLEAVLIPHVTSLLGNPLEFIVSVPLSVRLQQVPVSFAMNTLYQTGIVSYGLIGAAALAAAVIALLVAGSSDHELRGAGIAALLAGVVLLVPLLLALAGHDDYIARALMPGWPPLAITIAAACTAARARAAGAALAVVMVAMFIYAGARIAGDPSLEKVDWRAVSAALGPDRAPRAIVAYDGEFATAPLSLYLPRVAWAGPGAGPAPASATVRELDVIGSLGDRVARAPRGMRLIGAREVAGHEVARYRLIRPQTASPAELGTEATRLLTPAAGVPGVLIQPS
jgi:4-amino-4-deoxy-L-arabinose transferase-like glycosyltransferase